VGNALEEHYSYLSDPVRREKFEQAVAKAVTPGDTVADVGCGFGVLGLMCLKAGASHVWGIDRTEAIEIARETLQRSGFADRYTCVHETSFRAELPRPVDVLICDHVGFFGFDYGIIEMLGDARRRLLRPGGTILPSRIALQVAAVQSSACRELADAWLREPIPAEYAWLREYGVNTRHPRDFAPEEIASPPVELGTIDFRQDCPEHLAFTANIVPERSGELDGLAGWFSCELADGVWMTNSPLAPDRINRSQAFLPFATPLAVVAGDSLEVSISVRHETTLISWSARVARTGQSTRQSTWASTILDPRDRVPAGSRIPRLSAEGQARQALLALVDGQASNAEIEQAMLARFGGLFPSREQVERFIRSELSRSTQ